jgi:nicotinate-nucleotide adenylyltransferase
VNSHGGGRIIGLLGGSFNPAHGGHLHITQYALHRLGIDEVWWLVSPKNPLKSTQSLADYEDRLAGAKTMAAGHRHIRVSDLEKQEGLRYSYQTIALLKRRYPAVQFVWLMGADNLAQFHRWRRWRQILATIPIAVFDRAPYSHTALRSQAATGARKFLMKDNALNWRKPPPLLAFIHLRRDATSSTDIRKHLEKLPI